MGLIDGGGSGVPSVFGRTGAIAATTGDYTAAQVTNAADKSSAAAQAFTGELITGGGTQFRVTGSGAVASYAFVSGTARQILTSRDAFLFVPITFTPTAGAAATCLVELSHDNTTYTTFGTLTVPAGIALDSFILPLTLPIQVSDWLRLTATNATIGTGYAW